MGATLSSRVEWVSASDKGGELGFSSANEGLLLDILNNVESLCRDHPREAEVIFKRPFIWKSSLDLSQFDSLKPKGEYIARFVWFLCCSYMYAVLSLCCSDSGLVSAFKEDNGEPHLTVSKVIACVCSCDCFIYT